MIDAPKAKLMLLSDQAVGCKGAPDLEELRAKLGEIMEGAFELHPHGEAGVELTVPVRNVWELDGVKALIKSGLAGWKVIEKQNYSLPRAL